MDATDIETLHLIQNDKKVSEDFNAKKIDLCSVDRQNMFYSASHFTITHRFVAKNLIKVVDGIVMPNVDLIPIQHRTKQWMSLPSEAFETWLKLTKQVDNDDASVYLKVFTSCLTTSKAMPLCVLMNDFKALRFRCEPHLSGVRTFSDNTTDNPKYYTHDTRRFLVVNVEIHDRPVVMANNKKFVSKQIKFNQLNNVLELPIHFLDTDDNVIRTVDRSQCRNQQHGQFLVVFSAANSKHHHYVIPFDGTKRDAFTHNELKTPPNAGYYTAAIIEFVRVYFVKGYATIDCTVHHLFEMK